ncbi:hypothetical protein [Enterobacter roggenkampii]|uniref:hypothetical protein n=1 Tax=Enterobacter roggenkampii TaxID=1812935 RepID=UPI0039C3A225
MSFLSIAQVRQAIRNIVCYIDPNESKTHTHDIDSFIIYDASGDVLYRYMKNMKCFYENSPAFKAKRTPRNVAELTIFDAGAQFQWSTVFP